MLGNSGAEMRVNLSPGLSGKNLLLNTDENTNSEILRPSADGLSMTNFKKYKKQASLRGVRLSRPSADGD